MGIVEVDQGEVIRRDRHAKLAQRCLDALFLLGSQGHVFFEVFQRFNAVLNLPMPVVPLRIGYVLKHTVGSALSHIRNLL